MDIPTIILLLMLLLSPVRVSGLVVEAVANDDCVISMVIPRENIKSSCSKDAHTDMKLQSVESQLGRIRRDINNLQVKQAYSLTMKNTAEPVQDQLGAKVNELQEAMPTILDRLAQLEAENKDLKQICKTISSPEKSVSRKHFVKLVKPYIRKELRKLKMEIIKAIPDEKSQDSKKKKLDPNKHSESVKSKSLNKDNDKNDDDNKKEAIHQEDLVSTVDKSSDLNSRTETDRGTEAHQYQELNQNELPDEAESIPFTQSDAHYAGGINKLFQYFKDEMTDRFAQQSERVKNITNQHLNYITREMIIRDDNIKSDFNKKIDNLKQARLGAELNVNERLEKMENDISTTITAMKALTDNIFSDPNIVKEFENSKNEIKKKVTEDVLKETSMVALEMEDLKKEMSDKIKSKIGMLTADMRVELHHITNNITSLRQSILALNSSSPTQPFDYEVNVAEFQREIKIDNMMSYVKEVVEPGWKMIASNFSQFEAIHAEMRDHVNKNLLDIEARLGALKNNQSTIKEEIVAIETNMMTMKEDLTNLITKDIEESLKNKRWVIYNFKFTYGRSECHGKRYVKTTTYDTARFVGVSLCSETRYKIYLSQSLNDTFLNIGDLHDRGEDHCEFIGAHKNSTITVGRTAHQIERIEGYTRADWDEVPVKSLLTFFTPTPPWYECGIRIPGN